MVGEVVAGEGVDAVGVAGDVGDGDGDDLAVPGRRRDARRPAGAESVGIRREQCGGDQGGHVVTGLGPLDDLGDGGGVAHRELVDHVVGFGGHGCSIERPLTRV